MSSVFHLIIRSHPMMLFSLVFLIIAVTVCLILNVCGNSDCGCLCSCVKYINRVQKRRRERRHSSGKCSTCIELKQSEGQRLGPYEDYSYANSDLFIP